MTIAVCFKCGRIKRGAFVLCPECQALPQTEDELAISLAMTDHYFDQNGLEQMGQRIRSGQPMSLDPETREQLVSVIHGTKVQSQLNSAGAAKPKKRPWWKFW